MLLSSDDSMASAIESLKQLMGQIPAATAENVNVREKLLVATRKLMLQLERPDNTVERVGYQVPTHAGPTPHLSERMTD